MQTPYITKHCRRGHRFVWMPSVGRATASMPKTILTRVDCGCQKEHTQHAQITMTADVCLLLAQSLAGQCQPMVPEFTPPPSLMATANRAIAATGEAAVDPATPVELQLSRRQPRVTMPTVRAPQFSPPVSRQRPASGPQLYCQRQLSLQAGRLYTRLSPGQFAEQWRRATEQPTYQDWLQLLAQEARAAAVGQSHNRLDIVLGDSLGLWLPPDTLPRDRLWLNQSISGDTTAGLLRRLSAFAGTRPSTIHLLVGANDLKTGVPEAIIVQTMERLVQRLQRQHPYARIVLYSVLPTRRADITNDRVRSLNAQLATLTRELAVDYHDLHQRFQDDWGHLRYDLTTDGLHLTPRGYALWREAIVSN